MLWNLCLQSTELHICLTRLLSAFLFQLMQQTLEVGVALLGSWSQREAESHCGCSSPGRAQQRGLGGSHLSGNLSTKLYTLSLS